MSITDEQLIGTSSNPFDYKVISDEVYFIKSFFSKKTNQHLLDVLEYLNSNESEHWNAENVIKASNIKDAIEKANETNCKEVFIIGGGEIYKDCISITNRIYLTRVHTIIEGDAFFPIINEHEWTLISNNDFKADEKNAYDHSIQIWERKIIYENQ